MSEDKDLWQSELSPESTKLKLTQYESYWKHIDIILRPPQYETEAYSVRIILKTD